MPTYGYQPIVNDLKAAIEDGIYEPGARLPSNSELMKRYNTNIHMVRRAMTALMIDGTVYAVQGSGTFVSKQDRRRLAERFVVFVAELENSPRRQTITLQELITLAETVRAEW